MKNQFAKFGIGMEIIILIVSIFAFSFLVALPEIEQVSAQQENVACCNNLKNGATCQDMLVGDCGSECQGGCEFTTCEQNTYCNLGCCISDNGLCSANTPQGECDGE